MAGESVCGVCAARNVNLDSSPQPVCSISYARAPLSNHASNSALPKSHTFSYTKMTPQRVEQLQGELEALKRLYADEITAHSKTRKELNAGKRQLGRDKAQKQRAKNNDRPPKPPKQQPGGMSQHQSGAMTQDMDLSKLRRRFEKLTREDAAHASMS